MYHIVNYDHLLLCNWSRKRIKKSTSHN